MHRTRVKICGITRQEDALAAAHAGADAIGIVLHPGINRSVAIADAKDIIAALPAFIGVVGLFVNDEPDFIRRAAGELNLTAVQLHGQESLAILQALYPLPIIKAAPVESATFAAQLRDLREAVNLIGVLLDSAAGGGSGVPTDWQALRRHIEAGDLNDLPPWIAAGGLNPNNVAEVVRTLRPWAVDVSSGVESRPREKSAALIDQFIAAVRRADSEGPFSGEI